jgi:hypothetical protein
MFKAHKRNEKRPVRYYIHFKVVHIDSTIVKIYNSFHLYKTTRRENMLQLQQNTKGIIGRLKRYIVFDTVRLFSLHQHYFINERNISYLCFDFNYICSCII